MEEKTRKGRDESSGRKEKEKNTWEQMRGRQKRREEDHLRREKVRE